MSPSSSGWIFRAASVLAVFGLISRLVGLLRDRVLASHFGAGPVLDIYYAAFRIPDFIFNLIITGAMAAAFIPVFTRVYRENEKSGWKLVNNFLMSALLAVGILAIAGVIFAPQIIRLAVPGFTPEQQEITVRLTRIMFLSPMIFSISTVFGSVLQARRRFWAYAIAPIFYNIGIIVGVYFLEPWIGIDGLAIGVVVGALLHLVAQVPSVWGAGFSWRPFINFGDQNLKKIFFLMLPRTFALATSQINFTILNAVASTIAVGSISIFNLANNIWIAPVSLLGIALPTAIFPLMSELSADKKHAELVALLQRTMKQMLLIGIPLTIGTIVFGEIGIRLVLGVGQFNVSDVHLTALVVSAFALSIVPYSMVQLINRAFYALHDTKIPVIASIVSDVSTIALAFVFIRFAMTSDMRLIALALAISVGNVIQLMCVGLWFHRFARRFTS